ncbi:MAG: helix-turn-helix transcriptional regulator [Pseudomonadota bacterium]
MKRSKDLKFGKYAVVGLSDEYEDGFHDPKHCHREVQLLYACNGVMSVVADGMAIILPPQRALWIPAKMVHEVSCRGPVSLRTLYIEPSVSCRDSTCHIVEVGPLLRALILEISEIGLSSDSESRNRAIIDLTLTELSCAPRISHVAPMPRDARLLRVCNQILEQSADKRKLDDFATIAGMSRRCFTRNFKHETGMSFNFWRQQVRLQNALSLLLTGDSVGSAARKVGYESTSAFSLAFFRTYGVTPGQYGRS